MVKIKSPEVAEVKVWLLVGEDTGLLQPTRKYLKSQGQTVLHAHDLNTSAEELAIILHTHKTVDMLIVHDVKRGADLHPLFEKIHTFSSFMRRDGSSQVIFMLAGDQCFEQLQHTEIYRGLRDAMSDLNIHVKCFEAC